jgi:transposase
MGENTNVRSLSPEQQDLLRFKAVAMLKDGLKQVEIARLLDVHKDTVSRWAKKARTKGKKSLASRKRGSPPPVRLTAP